MYTEFLHVKSKLTTISTIVGQAITLSIDTLGTLNACFSESRFLLLQCRISACDETKETTGPDRRDRQELKLHRLRSELTTVD